MTDALSTPERILEHARDLYVEAGMNGFSMRKVAARAGITATAIYRHFDSKEALLMAVVEAGFQRFGRYLLRGLEGRTPLERLERSGEGYLRFALEHPGYYRMMFLSSPGDFGFEALPRRSAERTSPTFQMLADRVRECQDSGAFGPGDPVTLAATIWTLSHGMVSLYLTGHLRAQLPDDESFTAFFLASRRRLIDGLRPAGSCVLARQS
jgi:AcrR family transcriptional regulator